MSFYFNNYKVLDLDSRATVIDDTGDELFKIRTDTQITDTLTIGDGAGEYVFPDSRSFLNDRVLVDPGTGILEWRSVSGGIARSAFLKLTDNNTTYTLTLDDEILEVDSNTYTTINLPPSTGNGGQRYTISKGFDGGILNIVPFTGDTFDGSPEICQLRRLNQRISFYSSDDGNWNIV